VAVPANTTAIVYVPARDGGAITESDLPLEQAEGVELQSLEDGEAVMAVGSGRYEFVGSVG
jgi:alpha-L-rhamnosidase